MTPLLRPFLAAAGVAAAAGLAPFASAQVVLYTFDSGGAPTVVAGVTATTITNNAPTPLNAFSTSFNNGSYANNVFGAAPNAAGAGRNASTVLATDSYVSFTITPDAGQLLTLTDISFDAARGGSSTPRGFVLLSSIDGYTTPLLGGEVPTQRPVLTHFTSGALGAAFQDLAGATTFRLYVFAPSVANTVELNDLRFNGSVSPVPEPATWAGVLGAAALALAAFRRSRR